MYPVELRLDIFSLLILLGIFQGFFLTYFFLNKENRKLLSNRIYGFLLISLSLLIFDHWLNYTGYMTRVIFIDNFSEPLNFAIAPICYLYIKYSLKPNFKRRDYWHFAFFAFYVFYSFFYYLQTDEFKFNSFVWVNHPDWERIQAVQTFSDDPLQLRAHINQLTLLHFVVYLGFSIREVIKEVKSKKLQFWKLKNQQLRWLRNLCLHFFVVIIIFIVTKATLGRDLGDHFIASYITLIIYLASIKVVNDSLFFKKSNTAKVPEKYSKSSLNESQKDEILDQLCQVMQSEEYFTNNMASLPHLSKKIGCVSHHVSQVINERLGKSFFEWMAELRVEKAKELLSQNENQNITIEELAERVGYNSKSSFNKAFKKHTSQTPTQFKNTL